MRRRHGKGTIDPRDNPSRLLRLLGEYHRPILSTDAAGFHTGERANWGYAVELDESLLTEAVDLMFAELNQPENKKLSEWLLQFMQANIEEEKLESRPPGGHAGHATV